jgi:restriction system protein
MTALFFAVLFAVALVAVYAMLRRRSRDATPGRRDATLFGNDTTAFLSQLDSRLAEAAPPPGEPLYRGLRPPATVWNAQVFRDIEWRRFEAVCAQLFEQGAFEARHSPATPVGAADLREFHSAMVSRGLQRGTFVASGSFTPEAREFARSNGISALDGLALLALISRRPPQEQRELLAIAYEGEYWRPTCAACGLKMVEHSPPKGDPSWVCADAPRCTFTLPVRFAA